jgi:hypothetical protein
MSKHQDDSATHTPLPWIHKISADDAGVTIERVSIEPPQDAMLALAKHIDVDSLKGLKADLTLKRIKGGLVVYIKGHIKAEIEQTCVVTLESLNNTINEDFEAWYADPAQAISFQKALQKKELQRQHGEAPIVAEEDDPEPIEDGIIDLADVVIQFLSLAIDHYPQKDGIEKDEDEVVIVQEDNPIRKNPFEALKNWKSKMEEKS